MFRKKSLKKIREIIVQKQNKRHKKKKVILMMIKYDHYFHRKVINKILIRNTKYIILKCIKDMIIIKK